jgi:ABC-2 type transport system permease protein
MRRAVQAERLKLRTTRTTLWLLIAMLGLIALAVLLHGLGLAAAQLGEAPSQMRVFIAGQNVGAVFAALLGAMILTGELRHGTIRPTFLGFPQRRTVVIAKAVTAAGCGLLFGLLATALAAALTVLSFQSRDIDVVLTAGDFAQGIVGGGIGAALWAVLGLGVGGLVRNQVGTIVGLFIWLQLIENLLIDGAPSVSQFMPGALAQSIAGSEQGTISSPLLAAGLLLVYSSVVISASAVRVSRADVA